MSNPLYNAMSQQSNPFAQIMQEAQRLKNSFKGNPRDEVQKLLNSGAMSQQKFNELAQMAQQVINAMGGNK